MSEKNTRFYEIGYVFAPTIAEHEIEQEIAGISEILEKANGSVHSSGAPEFIDLAYTMEKTMGSKKYKYSQGYFGWIKFEIDPEAITAVSKALDGITGLVRYILIKTSVDNTVVFKKPKGDAKRETVLSEEEMDAIITASEAESAEEDVIAEHEKLPVLDIDSSNEISDSTEA